MPHWKPKAGILREETIEELTKLGLLKEKQEAPPISEPEERIVREPIGETWRPAMVSPPQQVTPAKPFVIPTPIKREAIVPEVKEEKPEALPFWQRALQVFAAPFVWIDEYVIKPGLAVAATGLNTIPELERRPAEEYLEWKKRSWEAWKPPGFDMNVPWSDDKVRVDLRGVLELAPWLLLPGAGQVGTGARVARGVAGVLGKVSRPLGYVVEYSPWGMVEKTAGAAMKAGVKAAGKGAARISERVGKRVFGEIVEEPIPPVVNKLSTFFDETVIPARKEFEKALPQLRAKQEAAVQGIWAKVRKGELSATEGTALVEKATAGAEKYKYAVPAKKFTKEEVDELLGIIVKGNERGLVARDSTIALRDLLLKGDLPQPHHIRDWAKVYGKGFAESARKFSQLPTDAKSKIIDALNLPRAVLASGDLSATFRQGLILMLTRPEKAPRAFWRQLKAFASEKLTRDMDDVLASHPLYNNAVRDGVEFTAWRKGARMAAKEEPFFSNLAERVPFVRRSERAFTTFLNEMRMGAYESSHAAMIAQGATAEQMKLMGRFINIASGRGTLPKNLDRYAPMLNTVLFSARYQMSTLQMPRQIGRMLLSKNPYMRKEAAKALVTFCGGGAALVSLLQATGTGKVETDPRAGDFGKVIIGDTRLDIWRGYVQYARFVGQIMTGERKSAYGNMNTAQRSEIASRFLQSKASPAMGMMVDLLKGENFMGETLFEGTKGVSKTVRDRVMPLALQDVMDAMEQSGTSGIWTAVPATMGIGVLTYINDFVRTKEKIARRMGYESWDDIDPMTQRQLENSNAELQAAFIEFDRQVMGTAWGDFRLAGKAIEDVFKDDVGRATAQYQTTRDGYQFREKIGDAFTARRGGYASRNKMPQFEDIVRRMETKDTAEALVGLGPEQLAIRTYNDALYGDDMYDEFGDYRFDLARIRKAQLRQQLGGELFDYVEQYRGLKYEDLSVEFQELARAKEVLRPYWEVKNWAEKHFGKAKTEWQQRRIDSFVSKIRKQLRRQNPEMERAYQQFYARS